jgi:hypothetical protein
MAGTATELNNLTVPHPFGKAIQKCAIERLVGQLCGNLVGVVPRDRVVRGARVFLAKPAFAGVIRQPPPPTVPVGRV